MTRTWTREESTDLRNVGGLREEGEEPAADHLEEHTEHNQLSWVAQDCLVFSPGLLRPAPILALTVTCVQNSSVSGNPKQLVTLFLGYKLHILRWKLLWAENFCTVQVHYVDI